MTVLYATVLSRNPIVNRYHSGIFLLQKKASRLPSEAGLYQAHGGSLELSLQKLAERDAKIEHLRKILTSVCGSLENGLSGSGNQSKFSLLQ